MELSSVLLALEEQEKWRERRKRVEERLVQLERRRAYLQRDLEHARKKISEFAGMLAEPRPGPAAIESTVPTRPFLR